MIDRDAKKLTILVSLDPDIQRLLQENNTDIEHLLSISKVDAQPGDVHQLPPEVVQTFQGTKDVLTVLVGTAVVALALAPTLKRLIDAFASRPILVEEFIWQPVESSTGEVVRDARGKPILKKVLHKKLLESQRSSQEELNIEGPMEIKVRYNASSKVE